MKKITKLQKDRLETRLKFVEDKFKEASQDLDEASKLGDLSENSEYDDAKSRRSMYNAERISIKDILENSIIIEPSKDNIITAGCLVHLIINGEDKGIMLISEEGNSIFDGVININSPVGRKILGTTGGLFELKLDSGDVHIEVKKIIEDRSKEFIELYPEEDERFNDIFDLSELNETK